MGAILVVLEASGIRSVSGQGVLMGPLDDIISGCVMYLIAVGIIIGLTVAVALWAIFS